LDEVTVLSRAALHGSESGCALLHLGEGFGDTLVSDGHLGHFDFEVFVVAKGEFGQNLEGGAELQWLAFVKFELFDLGLGDRCELLLGDGLFDALGDKGLEHFALDIFREATLNQRDRGFAGTKTRDPRDASELLGHLFGGFRYIFCGNLEVEFFPASGFRHVIISLFVNQRLVQTRDSRQTAPRNKNPSSRPAPNGEMELPCGNSAGYQEITSIKSIGDVSIRVNECRRWEARFLLGNREALRYACWRMEGPRCEGN